MSQQENKEKKTQLNPVEKLYFKKENKKTEKIVTSLFPIEMLNWLK